VIGEGDTQRGDNVVRYIYSGNQKVAMVRKGANGTETMYYFINNGQGTPVMIVNEAGAVVSRITMDEWGNITPVEHANLNEINYTGKKYDPATGLYYFNQRYYDPRIGRFLTEDPAGQAFNPYLYAGNNPLMYVDPDGEFFTEIFSALLPGLGTIIGAALDAGTISAGINAGTQLAFTGKIDGQGVLNAFGSGALSGGLSAGIGELGTALNLGNDLAFKTVAHGISGGIQSAVGGGSFGAGFVGGAVGNIGGHFMGDDLVGRTAVGGLAGGAGAWAAGGDFGMGFQAGAYNAMYNYWIHDRIREAYFKSGAEFLDWHYFRNAYNDPSQATVKMTWFESLLHGGHDKYISPDGHHEAVYNNGRLVGGSDRGTYNYYNPRTRPFMHTMKDVMPSFILGN